MGIKDFLEIAQKSGSVAIMAVGLALILKYVWPVLTAQLEKNAALANKISEDAQKRVSESQALMAEVAKDSHERMAEVATSFRISLEARDKLNEAQWGHSANLMAQMIKTHEKLSDRVQYLADRIPQK